MSTATNPCATFSAYDSLEYCPGQTILPGLRKKAYFISKSQILTFPTLPELSSSLDMDKAAMLVGNFGLAADAVAQRIDILDTASSLASASQGEKPSKTFLNTLTLKYPGNNAAAAGFCRMANADDMVFLVQQRDGKWRVVGSEAFDTDAKPAQDSGMAVTDASGTTVEITTTEVCPAPFFEGTIHTVDGWLNCKTGALTETEPTAA